MVQLCMVYMVYNTKYKFSTKISYYFIFTGESLARSRVKIPSSVVNLDRSRKQELSENRKPIQANCRIIALSRSKNYDDEIINYSIQQRSATRY